MEFYEAAEGGSVLRARRRNTLYELLCASRHFACQFHVERRAGASFSRQQVQCERGASLYAHFERFARQLEPGYQYASAARGFRPLHSFALAWTFPQRYDVAVQPVWNCCASRESLLLGIN